VQNFEHLNFLRWRPDIPAKTYPGCGENRNDTGSVPANLWILWGHAWWSDATAWVGYAMSTTTTTTTTTMWEEKFFPHLPP